jgi:hypothetical protein
MVICCSLVSLPIHSGIVPSHRRDSSFTSDRGLIGHSQLSHVTPCTQCSSRRWRRTATKTRCLAMCIIAPPRYLAPPVTQPAHTRRSTGEGTHGGWYLKPYAQWVSEFRYAFERRSRQTLAESESERVANTHVPTYPWVAAVIPGRLHTLSLCPRVLLLPCDVAPAR